MKQNKRFFNKKNWLIIGLGLLVVMILTAVTLPLPYYLEKPGSTIDLKQIIKVNDQEDEATGSFSLTSVSYQRATPFSLLLAQFNSFVEVESQEQMLGAASSSDEFNQIQEFYMESSKNNAIQVAFKLAGIDYTMKYQGIYVLSIQEDSNFADDLTLGDTITQADGQNFESVQEFTSYVQSKNIGDELTITYVHGGEERTSTQKLVELSPTGKAGIGISLVENSGIVSDTNVAINTGRIGGPSAGLMFSLEIYDQLTEGDLRHGKNIAGTGMIDIEGNVGPIGGIDKKVASASDSGAEIFFAPVAGDDYEDAVAAAEKLNTDMVIVPVETIQDALDYLNNLDK